MPNELLPNDIVNLNHDSISALFLGPKAENVELMKVLFEKVLDKQRHARENYHREDKVNEIFLRSEPFDVIANLSYRFSSQTK